METSFVLIGDYKNEKVKDYLFYVDVKGVFTPEQDGFYDFGLTTHGTAQLFIDGESVVDNSKDQIPGDSFFGAGTIEVRGAIELKAGKSYDVLVEFGSAPTSKMNIPGVTSMGAGGFFLGGIRRMDPSEEIAKAVTLAKAVDQVIICAGLNADFESEGYDRPHMDLPGHIDQLISSVAAANPNTVVVMQSGTPVTMPWLDQVPSLVQAWYGGNETGNAIADVLFGDVNPSGKLPLSFPVRNEDNPAFLSYRSELGRTVYTDDVFVGYRHYEKVGKKVNFPFGHGLSYTSFRYGNLRVGTSGEGVEAKLVVEVEVTNEGKVAGKEVVQVFVAPPVGSAVTRPVRELKCC
jgi:beta-glucosidase